LLSGAASVAAAVGRILAEIHHTGRTVRVLRAGHIDHIPGLVRMGCTAVHIGEGPAAAAVALVQLAAGLADELLDVEPEAALAVAGRAAHAAGHAVGVDAAPEAVLAVVSGVGPVDEPPAVPQGVVAERGGGLVDQQLPAQDAVVVDVDHLDLVEPLRHEPLAVQQDELGVVAERGGGLVDQQLAAQDAVVVDADHLDLVEPVRHESRAVQQDELGVVAERWDEPVDQQLAAQDVVVVGVDHLHLVDRLGWDHPFVLVAVDARQVSGLFPILQQFVVAGEPFVPWELPTQQVVAVVPVALTAPVFWVPLGWN
jgi:hypothetical protein